ncbi:COG3650 family protein [Pelagerythrobacter sp.]|uniref:COG3650 family protein n=1 Tax=Pelagerythrobacter sp. TaxID=2800702 RepID=UPI0035AF3322
MTFRLAIAASSFLALAACQPGPEGPEGTTRESPGAAFAAIGPEETVRFVGTEPFWGGEASGERLLYTTVENQEGFEIAVERFAGNNGLGYSGTLEGEAFDMAITPGECSDGMSDRTFPFTVTLKIGAEQRGGCAWTDRAPFTGPENP